LENFGRVLKSRWIFDNWRDQGFGFLREGDQGKREEDDGDEKKSRRTHRKI
jgi:hypothetical protein